MSGASPVLILASASPRRRELLWQIGIAHRVEPADLDETRIAGEAPGDYVRRLALAKAQYVWQRQQAEASPDAAGSSQPVPIVRLPVLGADTAVVLGSEIFGKPRDRDDALGVLERLAGRVHEVYSAVALVHAGGVASELSISRVRFAALDAAQRLAYWDSGEPCDKAGAYGIQGRAAAFIEHLDGSYSGVMGLPLFETARLLSAAGVQSDTGAGAKVGL